MPPEDRYLEASGVCTSETTAGGPFSSLCGEFGFAAQGPGDATGDGVPDQLISAWTYSSGTGCGAPEPNNCTEAVGRMYLFSGATGQVVHKLDNPEPQVGARLGLQEVAEDSPGDVNRDGGADLYANGFVQDTPQTDGPAEGKAWVFSGKRGNVLYSITDPSPEPGGQFGYSLARTDYDKDGGADLYVGSSPQHEPGTNQVGGTYVFNGPNGSLLKILDLPPEDVQIGTATNLGPQLGRATAAPGDLNGDGEPDYVAGAPAVDEGFPDVGRLYFFLSDVGGGGGGGAVPAGLNPGRCANERRGTNASETINGTTAGDRLLGLGGNDRLNGLQGADCLYGGDRKDTLQGAEGADLLRGESGADILGGGSGRDRLSGGRGNDKLTGGSGADRLAGGSGRDKLSGGTGNDRLSGGSGADTLAGGQGRNRLSGGSGNDVVNSADGKRETVRCGRGRDVVRADRSDRLRGCERVRLGRTR